MKSSLIGKHEARLHGCLLLNNVFVSILLEYLFVLKLSKISKKLHGRNYENTGNERKVTSIKYNSPFVTQDK